MLKGPKPPFDDKEIIAQTKIKIEKNESELSIVAETQRIIIRPVKAEDVSFYQKELWGSSKVMEKFADGQPRLYKDEESKTAGIVDYAQNRIVDAQDSWCNRWKNHNPWSGMTVIDKKNQRPIGHVVIGGGEVAYLFVPGAWGQRLGSEAVTVLTKAILPALILSGNAGNLPQSIEATTRVDHNASQVVLQRAGLSSDHQVNKRTFGDKEYERFIYKANVAELVCGYQTIKNEIRKRGYNNPHFSLALFHLRSKSPSRIMNEVNVAGYSLRATKIRKNRYSL